MNSSLCVRDGGPRAAKMFFESFFIFISALPALISVRLPAPRRTHLAHKPACPHGARGSRRFPWRLRRNEESRSLARPRPCLSSPSARPLPRRCMRRRRRRHRHRSQPLPSPRAASVGARPRATRPRAPAPFARRPGRSAPLSLRRSGRARAWARALGRVLGRGQGVCVRRPRGLRLRGGQIAPTAAARGCLGGSWRSCTSGRRRCPRGGQAARSSRPARRGGDMGARRGAGRPKREGALRQRGRAPGVSRPGALPLGPRGGSGGRRRARSSAGVCASLQGRASGRRGARPSPSPPRGCSTRGPAARPPRSSHAAAAGAPPAPPSY